MGCVTEITSTGDNDEPIFPQRYYRHYLYCDQCGSFELQPNEELQQGFWGRLFRMKEIRSVRCSQCQTIYRFGTPFFTNHDANPRGFTMADLPRPMSRAYSVVGRTLRPDEDG